ncbi:MAG: hypothetical protein IT371_06165 [Deltaproteobacteria bacterium]|nr:hypothetical protein [Deltaproteobacteria bacterium]
MYDGWSTLEALEGRWLVDFTALGPAWTWLGNQPLELLDECGVPQRRVGSLALSTLAERPPAGAGRGSGPTGPTVPVRFEHAPVEVPWHRLRLCLPPLLLSPGTILPLELEGALRRGAYAELVETLLRRDPAARDGRWRIALGAAVEGLGRPEEALRLLDEAGREPGANDLWLAATTTAVSALRRVGQPEEALALLEQRRPRLATLSPMERDRFTLLELVTQFEVEGQSPDLTSAVEEVVTRLRTAGPTRRAEALLTAGRLSLDRGLPARARAELEETLTTLGEVPALPLAGRIFAALASTCSALEAEAHARGYAALAVACFRRARCDGELLDALQLLVRLSPDDPAVPRLEEERDGLARGLSLPFAPWAMPVGQLLCSAPREHLSLAACAARDLPLALHAPVVGALGSHAQRLGLELERLIAFATDGARLYHAAVRGGRPGPGATTAPLPAAHRTRLHAQLAPDGAHAADFRALLEATLERWPGLFEELARSLCQELLTTLPWGGREPDRAELAEFVGATLRQGFRVEQACDLAFAELQHERLQRALPWPRDQLCLCGADLRPFVYCCEPEAPLDLSDRLGELASGASLFSPCCGTELHGFRCLACHQRYTWELGVVARAA